MPPLCLLCRYGAQLDSAGITLDTYQFQVAGIVDRVKEKIVDVTWNQKTWMFISKPKDEKKISDTLLNIPGIANSGIPKIKVKVS